MSNESPASSERSRRQKSDKTGRLSALQKLKELKGSKNKYEVDSVDDVYMEVDEKEYSKTVLERQNDDWIVDDGGNGYVEDGREIFDDDLDDESIQQAKKHSVAGPRKKKKDDIKRKGSIQSMLVNMPSKRKADALNDDDILGDLMSELKNNKMRKTESKTEPRVIKNIFCTSAESNSIKTHTAKLTEMPAEIPIETVDIDNDDVIFNKTNKTVQRKVPSCTKTGTSSHKQSLSQQIQEVSDDTTSTDSTIVIESNSDSSFQSKNTSKIQVIEEESEDLDKCLVDLTDDFGNSPIKSTEKECNKTSSSKHQIGTTEIQNIISETMSEETIGEMFETESFTRIWDDKYTIQEPTVEICTDTANLPLPLTKTAKGEEVLRFYWWDAYEDPFRQPGVVYLFGKIFIPSLKSYNSCCLTIKNIPRRIFLLPRTYVKTAGNEEISNTMENVYKEFNQYATKVGIKEFRCSTVIKNYAFEQEGTPKESEYLQVRYAANYPSMSESYSGPAIERVFGTTINALELFLIERNIKGPCWLDVKNAVPTEMQTSWCNIKATCMKMENISVSEESQPLPPIIVGTLNIRTCLNTRNRQNEVVMVAILLHHKYHVDKEPPKPLFQQHFCLITSPRENPWPRQAKEALTKITYTKIIKCDRENDLLEELLNILNKADPDLILGYDCGYQFDMLIQRMANLKVSNWSRLGRLKRSTLPIIKGKIFLGQVFIGRPVCDIQISAKELNLKVRSYDLQSLCMAVLKKKENECREVKPEECSAFYNTIEKIENLIQITLAEALYILTIVFELNVIPLALQITCIAGNIISRTLSAGRAERNEYLLLHAFHLKNYITPDRRVVKKGKDQDVADNPRRKKAAYVGGLVLEPKKGFYDKLILLMDFNSLYPSIIQEYNLCFTTVPGAAYADSEDLTIPESDLDPGVIPTEIRKLVESRGQVKKLMKAPNLSPELKMQYNIRQLALKLTANSMYGCLGATHCRFYAKGLAALITAKGREILQNTKSLVEKLNYDVIYGDTDSIMINTNIVDYEEVFAVGKKIKQEVNKLYKRVELDIDGVFRYLLLLQKKKYAAVTMTKLSNGQIELAQEHKGLDIVRRDWCQLACDVGKKILDQLLCDQPGDNRLGQIFSILEAVAKNVRENTIPLSLLVITKQLSKNPENYPDKKQAHVQVALRLNKSGGRMWKAGDTIPYIVCEDGSDKSATERAYHVDELKKSDSLKIDVNYYLISQIFPIVLRICEPIEGIDDVLLAKTMGLQEIYKVKRPLHETEALAVPIALNENRYKYCRPLKFDCIGCNHQNILKEVVSETPNGRQLGLFACQNVDCKVAPWTYWKIISNNLSMAIRDVITEYYDCKLECENPLCSNVIRSLPIDFFAKHPFCKECNDSTMLRIYSETMLYNQLSFYVHLFDIHEPDYKVLLAQSPHAMVAAYDNLKELAEKYVRRNSYSVVDLDAIFSQMTVQASPVNRVEEHLEMDSGSESEDELVFTMKDKGEKSTTDE